MADTQRSRLRAETIILPGWCVVEGYGAFSYSRSQVETVYNYVLNQESHYGKKTFKQEYIEFLKNFQLEYDERYLFDWIE